MRAELPANTHVANNCKTGTLGGVPVFYQVFALVNHREFYIGRTEMIGIGVNWFVSVTRLGLIYRQYFYPFIRPPGKQGEYRLSTH
jgi:hypothetical protein